MGNGHNWASVLDLEKKKKAARQQRKPLPPNVGMMSLQQSLGNKATAGLLGEQVAKEDKEDKKKKVPPPILDRSLVQQSPGQRATPGQRTANEKEGAEDGKEIEVQNQQSFATDLESSESPEKKICYEAEIEFPLSPFKRGKWSFLSPLQVTSEACLTSERSASLLHPETEAMKHEVALSLISAGVNGAKVSLSPFVAGEASLGKKLEGSLEAGGKLAFEGEWESKPLGSRPVVKNLTIVGGGGAALTSAFKSGEGWENKLEGSGELALKGRLHDKASISAGIKISAEQSLSSGHGKVTFELIILRVNFGIEPKKKKK